MKLAAGFALLLLPLLPSVSRGQAAPDTVSHAALHLAIRDYGISVGNAPRVHGLRLNWRDRGLEQVDGVNLTLFGVDANPGAAIHGLGINLVGGAYAGGIGEFAIPHGDWVSEVDGLGLSLFTVSAGRTNGFLIAGLIAQTGHMTGLIVGGLGCAGDSGVGAKIGGIVVTGEGPMVGLTAGALTWNRGPQTGVSTGAVVIASELAGINAGGIVVAERIAGLNVAGGIGSKDVRGITVSGFTYSSRVAGLTAGLIAIGEPSMKRPEVVPDVGGVALSALLTAKDLRGGTIAVANRVTGVQRGIAIGVYNEARELHGLQLGLVNVARNRQGWTRVLPVINVGRGH